MKTEQELLERSAEEIQAGINNGLWILIDTPEGKIVTSKTLFGMDGKSVEKHVEMVKRHNGFELARTWAKTLEAAR